ncbi:hypothetical protein FOA52_001803 [Chlamydomonas sp. UWO 241]|nr:hypothetical protein FOA52_001803 [Chlamydomonas sp. UWO 241]
MTPSVLKQICKDTQLYRTPALNDKLYLNFKGFTQISSLEEYTGLKALFLEGNAIDSIEGLPALPELRCLFLQQNALWELSHLEGVPELDTLNVSQNAIERLENLEAVPKLASLIATHCQLESPDSIAGVLACPGLHTLDLQHNNISDPAVLDVLKQLPLLTCLYLKGNPVVSTTKNYRKTFIAALPKLGYLDERPVFEDERRMVDAWAVGGVEAERAERQKIKEEKEAYDRRNFEAMQEMRRAGYAARRAAQGLPPGDTDPALDDFDDSEYVFDEDPPELVEARKRLAAYTGRDGEEEPPELSAARREVAAGGGGVTEAKWATENDGEIYFASVNRGAAAVEEDEGGGGAGSLGGAKAGARASSDDVRQPDATSKAGGAGGAADKGPVSVLEASASHVEVIDLDEMD